MGLLRFLLALSVAQGHALQIFGLSGSLFGSRWLGGLAAVQVFYMISGFYMALILAEKYPSTSSGRRLFWFNRFWRLWPTYAVVLAGVIAWKGIPQLVSEWSRLGVSAQAAFALIHATLLGQDQAFFFQVTPQGTLQWSAHAPVAPLPAWHFLLIPQAWTLSLELCFYVIAPWVVRASTRTQWMLLGASVLVRVALTLGGLKGDPWTFRFFPSELALFVLGSLAYRHGQSIPQTMLKRYGLCALAGILVLFCVYPWIPSHGWGRNILIFAWVGASLPFLFELTRRNPWDEGLGSLSYPVYLTHIVFLVELARRHGSEGSPLWAYLGILGSILASVVLVLAVERPVNRWRQQRWNNRRAA